MSRKMRKHVRGIVDELMNNAIKAKATQVDIHLDLGEKEIVVNVKDNGVGMNEERLAEVRKKIGQPRRHELEEYYGALAGQSMVGTGLSIVGMMTDKAEVLSQPGEGTEVTVWLRPEGEL